MHHIISVVQYIVCTLVPFPPSFITKANDDNHEMFIKVEAGISSNSVA